MEVSAAPAWAAALEASGFGDAMRNSLYLYPLANLIHILGFILLIGPIWCSIYVCSGSGAVSQFRRPRRSSRV